MKKIIYAFVLLVVSSMSIIACAQGKASKEQNDMKENKKVLVTYFSRTGENYSVGNITKGNTQIVAEIIANETGGNLFRWSGLTNTQKCSLPVATTPKLASVRRQR